MFICKKCGKADVPRRGNRKKCIYCERDYLREWKAKHPEKQKTYNQENVVQKRRSIKALCVEYLGGVCQNSPKCFYPREVDVPYCPMTMEFHHKDPSTKEMELSRRMRVGGLSKINTIDDLKKYAPEIIAELDKCLLLCGNCHAHLEYCCSRPLS